MAIIVLDVKYLPLTSENISRQALYQLLINDTDDLIPGATLVTENMGPITCGIGSMAKFFQGLSRTITLRKSGWCVDNHEELLITPDFKTLHPKY